MQGVLWYIDHTGSVQLLVTGAIAFAGSVFVILLIGWLVSLIGGPLGYLLRAFSNVYREIIRGATFITGTRYVPLFRWSIFVFWSVTFIITVSAGPPGLVLAVLVAGFAFVFAILQHALWDEDEQSRDVTGTAKNINVAVDLRLEAVWAIGLLFCLAAMGFSYLDKAYGVFPATPGSLLWVLSRAPFYVWGEVPEGVPVIDATSVYRNGNLLTGFSYRNPELAMATFWLRVVYEIFVVAALIQLATVAVRLAEKGALAELDRALKFGDPKHKQRAMTELNRLALRHRTDAIRFLASMLTLKRFAPSWRYQAAGYLYDIAEKWGGTGILFEIVNGYRKILEELSDESNEPQRALTLNRMGLSMYLLGQRIGGEEGLRMLKSAVTSCTAAIAINRKSELKLEEATAQSNLGLALWALGDVLGGEDGVLKYREAIAAYRVALEIYSESDTPNNWATTQNNLGLVLSALGKRLEGEPSIAKFEAAIEAYAAALRVYAKQGNWTAWARTQNNMGLSLAALGKMLGGAERLIKFQAAIESNRAALKIRTRKNMPVDWAMSQSNLGLVYWSLGEQQGGAEAITSFEIALAAIRSALEIFTEGEMPTNWATAQNNLGLALVSLARLLDGPEGIAKLEEAIVSYNATFRVYTEREMPVNWATSQDNLGWALQALGKRLGGARGLEKAIEAVAAHEAALRVYTKMGDAIAAAAVKRNLEEAQRLRADLEGGSA